MTLRAKASIILCLLISAALGITGYFYLSFFETSLRVSILKGLTSVADTSSQVITRFMSDSLMEAQAVARALPPESLEKQDARSIENILKDYLKIFPKFENGMFILDAEGTLWADYPVHPQVRGKSFEYRQYYKRTMAEQSGIIGEPYHSARTGQPVLTFTALLKDKFGKTIGMLGCSVQLTSPKALEGIRLMKIGRSGYIYVYNKERLMILHPKEERILKRDVPPGANKLFDAAIEGFEGTGETVNSRGVPMLISLKHIDGTNWIMGCQQPISEAFAPIIKARKRIIATILLAAVSAGILGAFLMRSITVPLIRLQEASRLMEQTIWAHKKVHLDKTEFNRKLESIPQKGELGDLKHAFLTMQEKLEQTMRSLQKAATDWESTFDSVNDIIFLLDPKDRILRLNRSARHLIAKSDKTLIGLPIRECLPELPAKFYSITDPPQSDSQTNYINIDIKSAEGDLRTYEMACAPLIDENGSNIGMVISGKDITPRLAAEAEKSRLEKRLQKAQQMEAIGTLAGGVAHDLNNILSGVLSYPELLLMQIPQDSELRLPLEIIMQSGAKASAIVQDLLTLARRGVASIEVLDLNAIIGEYLKSPEFEKLGYHHPGTRVVTNLDADLLYIEGSPIHLLKTIMNLVSNAAEAMPNGGKIIISTANQHVDTVSNGHEEIPKGDYAVVKVFDEGLGIGEAERERIFEPFYTKKVMGRSGTGLGMSVVWGTVKDHKGHIDVRSEVGSWTEFTLYLPATRKKPKEPEPNVDLAELTGNGEFILVVDDVQEQRTIAVSILRKLGYSADSVSNGEDALAYMKKRSVDLLILDMIMDPGMDGYETFKQALQVNPQQKAIIASGFSETEAVKNTQALGAGAYLKKPYTIKSIGIAVKRELAK